MGSDTTVQLLVAFVCAVVLAILVIACLGAWQQRKAKQQKPYGGPAELLESEAEAFRPSGGFAESQPGQTR